MMKSTVEPSPSSRVLIWPTKKTQYSLYDLVRIDLKNYTWSHISPLLNIQGDIVLDVIFHVGSQNLSSPLANLLRDRVGEVTGEVVDA